MGKSYVGVDSVIEMKSMQNKIWLNWKEKYRGPYLVKVKGFYVFSKPLIRELERDSVII